MSVCTTTQNFYKGDGVITNYPFTFEYPADRPDFVNVALWDTTKNEYVETTAWTFDGPTIVKFDVAPPSPPTINSIVVDNIRIYRVTDVDPLEATFYPGSAIKADDLNDTFIQLQNSIQEIQCYEQESSYTGNIDVLTFYLKRADDSILGYIDNESNEAFRLPVGTSAQRPASPKLGDSRYNTSINKIEFYENSGWTSRDSDFSELFQTLPTDGSPITSGEALVPIVFPDGIQLPDQTSSYAVEGAIRVNLSNEKLEVYLDGDWTTASAGAEVGASPPSPSTQGDVWWDSDSGRAYVYYNDTDSSQWVEMNPSWNGSVPDNSVSTDKLQDGSVTPEKLDREYVEQIVAGNNITLSPADGKGVVTVNSTEAQLAGFRNQIINGDFRIWQRGTDFTSGLAGYCADRFYWSSGADPIQAQLSTRNLPVGFSYAIVLNATTPAIQQGVELYRAGQNNQFTNGSTWTMSVWSTIDLSSTPARLEWKNGIATLGTLAHGAATYASTGETSGDFTRYSATVVINTNAPAGSNSLSMIVADASVKRFTGFQLELGPVATPFEQRPIGTELALCQRYYQVFDSRIFLTVRSSDATKKIANIFYQTTMRMTPTATIDDGGTAGTKTFSGNSTNTSGYISTDNAASGSNTYLEELTLDAEL